MAPEQDSRGRLSRTRAAAKRPPPDPPTGASSGGLLLAAQRDPLVRAGPARVDGRPRAVEVQEQGRVVRRDGLALARLAVDLRPDAPLRDRCRDEEVIDAHALVALEVAGPVVPPRVPLGLAVGQPICVDEPPADEPAAGGAL